MICTTCIFTGANDPSVLNLNRQDDDFDGDRFTFRRRGDLPTREKSRTTAGQPKPLIPENLPHENERSQQFPSSESIEDYGTGFGMDYTGTGQRRIDFEDKIKIAEDEELHAELANLKENPDDGSGEEQLTAESGIGKEEVAESPKPDDHQKEEVPSQQEQFREPIAQLLANKSNESLEASESPEEGEHFFALL